MAAASTSVCQPSSVTRAERLSFGIRRLLSKRDKMEHLTVVETPTVLASAETWLLGDVFDSYVALIANKTCKSDRN